MYDTFLAVILLCSINGGLDIKDSCKYLLDKRGPAGTMVACRTRLDDLWGRFQLNAEMVASTHKEIGDYKLNYASHRGFCLDQKLVAQNGVESEIRKYYEQ
jgi:hypothetical protein